jgi:serine/threonine protein kinase
VPLVPGDPSEIGKYRLVARLGQGGMGVVYLGRTPGERLVAVKVVRDDLDFDDTFRRRFRREVQAVRQVGGFFTASVVDAAPDADPPWLVTEYVPGPSLEQAVAEQGALSAKPLRALAAGLAEALEGIHACGIIHRDLKPSNIILTDSGPRVIDFGIARALDHSALTRTNQWVGTPGYLAPEQLAGGEVTPRADVYALGVVLCHAASGDFPYRGGAAPLDLLPSLLREIVAACLANDPHERPAPGEILKQLN